MRRFRFERSTIAFIGALALVMLALLVGPRIPDSQQARNCVVNVDLPGPFGLSLNCDSPEFMRLASRPVHLFDPQNERQSRPGLIVAAALLSLPLMPLSNAAQWLGLRAERQDIDPHRISNALANYPPAFVAYLILNIALLAAAFHYFRWIAAPPGTDKSDAWVVVVSVGLLLIANDVVKGVWTPHTQMFNILVPVLGVYVALRAAAPEPPSRRFVTGMGIVTGLGVTAYALFVVLVPCVVAPLLLRAFQKSREVALARLTDAALFCMLSAAPFILWYLLVHAVTGSFYQHELALGQVTWMQQAYSDQGAGGVLGGLLDNLMTLMAMAAHQAGALAAMALWVLVFALRQPESRRKLHGVPRVFFTALFVSALVGGFYASTGFIVDRLAYAMLPALIVVIGRAAVVVAEGLPATSRRALGVGCLGIAVAQAAFMIHRYPGLE